ncbi:MAG: S8/S53 family peptidase [Beijerinckiaceae bacterium]|nr:S8/S53 family peptidase [Beijerinckiaceae bacterium]
MLERNLLLARIFCSFPYGAVERQLAGRNAIRLVSALAYLFAAATLAAAPAHAQSVTGEMRGPPAARVPAPLPQAPGAPIFIDKKAPSEAGAAAASALMAKAAAKGVIRVIAGLNIKVRAPHELSAAEAAGQERALRSVQTSVVSRVLGAEAAGASVTGFEFIPFMAMNVTAAQLSRLLADPEVLNVQEDVALAPQLTESVPFINADDVWTAGFPGTGFTVAILDTGVDKTHNMFPGSKIISEACYSPTMPGQSASLCPGGVSSSVAPGSGVNCPSPGVSGCYHGTAVAGIAAGNMASPLLRGVARRSQIIAIQVASRFDDPADCGPLPAPCAKSMISNAISGLQRVYALRNTFQIAAVNLSLGAGNFFAPCDTHIPSMSAAINLLRRARIAAVAATGNRGFNGSMLFPACISSAIAVGSTLDTANTLSSFSNHSANVRLLAPGSNIKTSIPPGSATAAVASGTSFATPHVTGAFALLRDVKGGSTVDDISAALECTGVPVTRAGITERRIDVEAARLYLLNPPNAISAFNFSAAAQAAKWTPFIGSWGVNTAAPGTYRVAPVTAGWKFSTIDNCNENVTVVSRLKRTWPAGQRSNAGVAFKAQLSAANNTIHGYMAVINRDLPGNDHPNNVALYRLDGLNLATGAGASKLLCNADLDTIASGTFYTLRVVSAGGAHRVFLDDVLRCQAVDYSYGTGRAGLITFIGSPAAGNAFEADSFILDPNETVPVSSPAAQDMASGK